MARSTRGGRSGKTGNNTAKPADTEDTVATAADTLPGEDTLAASDDSQPAADDSISATDDSLPTADDTIPAEDAVTTVEDTVVPTGADSVPDEPVTGFEDDTLDLPPEPATDADTLTAAGSDTLASPAEDTLTGQADAPAADPIAAEAMAPAAPTVVERTVVERKAGFIPMLLGGVVAAGLGFAAGSYTDLLGGEPEGEDPFVAETRAALDSQADRVAALDARMTEAETAIGALDTAPLSSAITGLEDSVATGATGLTDLGAQLEALGARMTALEKKPVADVVSPEAIAAYERELDELRQAIAAQSAAMEAERQEIEVIAKEAMEAEAQADSKAILAESRAALAELTARAQDGQPFAEPLAILQENAVDVPGALVSTAETGVPTTTALAESFPDQARDALRAARSGAAEGQGGGLGGFLQNQLGARSVTPRDGDDADAVLSRAEAAVRQGDIATALTEIQALPPEAQAELADWTAQASLRRDALTAAQALGQELNNEQGSE